MKVSLVAGMAHSPVAVGVVHVLQHRAKVGLQLGRFEQCWRNLEHRVELMVISG